MKPRMLLLVFLLIPGQAWAQESAGLAGSWLAQHHEEGGGDAPPGDFAGMPLSDEGRARANTWHSSLQSMVERQCTPYPQFFGVTGFPTSMELVPEHDPISGVVTAWKIGMYFGTRTIYMDGRPHPGPYARHTSSGFSTGEMIGDTLHIRTTHLTEGPIWQSGVLSSNQATISEYISRAGDMLSVTMILYDPVYLTEPLVRTKTHVYTPAVHVMSPSCEPFAEVPMPAGEVPHYLPGKNPTLTTLTEHFGVPLEAAQGHAHTLYPEYRKTLKNQPAQQSTHSR
jgi:hypothetical protein